MSVRLRMTAILFLLTYALTFGCEIDDVAVYNVSLEMLWSEQRFPKDYPLSPKAQWSQVFGQSHNSTYAIYHIGDVARPSVRKFAQTGELHDLMMESDEEPKIYDQFVTPAVGSGTGYTGNMVLVDGGHTMVSLISRMIPSPDWFIGVDSLNLCVDSSWVDQVTLDLSPLDAGAESGLTFTSPEWATVPPVGVTKHRPRDPGHPGAGFYYPMLRELPAIATATFTKIKQYSTIELNDLARKELLSKHFKKENHQEVEETKHYEETDYEDESNERTNYDRLKNLEEEPFGTPRPNVPENNVVVITTPETLSTPIDNMNSELRNMDEVVLAVAHGRKLGLGKHLPRHFKSRLHHAVNRIQPNDCVVSEWSDWSPCSTTCNVGVRRRRRHVLRQQTAGGRRCPALTQRGKCGERYICA